MRCRGYATKASRMLQFFKCKMPMQGHSSVVPFQCLHDRADFGLILTACVWVTSACVRWSA